VISSIHRRYRAQHFRNMIKLGTGVPAGVDVRLICHNYSTHKAPTVRARVQRHPRSHVRLTPTYSSCSTAPIRS
jgi:hypothetical protein